MKLILLTSVDLLVFGKSDMCSAGQGKWPIVHNLLKMTVDAKKKWGAHNNLIRTA